jgi:hypothetical protein
VGSLSVSLALDYRSVDGTETVTYTAKRSGGNTTLTVNFAEPRDYTLKEITALGGMVQAGDREWGLGNAEFTGGLTPQRGDTVAQADGTVWELIADPTLDEFKITWSCPSRKAR